ncbi:hypothetical protein DFP72DRAFT_1169443, partial [Ephemerocybe angulata]
TAKPNKGATEPERLLIRSKIRLKSRGIIRCCLPPPCRRLQSPSPSTHLAERNDGSARPHVELAGVRRGSARPSTPPGIDVPFE